MTPQEIKAELRKLREEAGINAYVDVTVKADEYCGDELVSGVLYPFGVGSSDEGYIRVTASDFPEALQNLRKEWDSRKVAHHAEMVKKMALAIIRITTDRGECTEAALRHEFDAGQVRSCADDACKLADEMAGRGPFKVKRARGANAA